MNKNKYRTRQTSVEHRDFSLFPYCLARRTISSQHNNNDYDNIILKYIVIPHYVYSMDTAMSTHGRRCLSISSQLLFAEISPRLDSQATVTILPLLLYSRDPMCYKPSRVMKRLLIYQNLIARWEPTKFLNDIKVLVWIALQIAKVLR